MAAVIRAKLATSDQGSHSKKKQKQGGIKLRSSKAEGVAVNGHLKTRVNTTACYCLCSLPLQHLLWAYGRQLAQPQAR